MQICIPNFANITHKEETKILSINYDDLNNIYHCLVFPNFLLTGCHHYHIKYELLSHAYENGDICEKRGGDYKLENRHN